MKSRQLIIPLLLSFFCSCKDEGTPPPPPQPYVPTIQLSMEDASCTEAWLKVKLTDGAKPRTVAVKRDSQTVLTTRLTTSDSVLIDENLLPRRTYTYRVFRLNGTTPTDSSTPVQVTTMDTTSHNFTWQLDTLGDAYSMLSDVAIINDTLAYAVGEMHLRDSTGQIDPDRYNAAIWNGRGWAIHRIPYNFGGQQFVHPIQSVFSFGANDIWFCGNGIIRWDGVRYLEVPVPSSVWGQDQMNRIWGSSSRDLYVIGNNGAIANYNGSWQRLTTGTMLNFRDIWGSRNRSGQMEILALASEYTVQTQDVRIFQLSGNSATPVNVNGLAAYELGIWFEPGMEYYAVGDGVHRKRMLSDSAWVVYQRGVLTRFASGGVRGSGINNVFVVGSFGEVVHFNGVNWNRYFGAVPIPSGALGRLAVRDRLVMAVGDIGASRGIVLIGRR